ncbi:signal transduction histidine kinase [Curtobacterium flaccumfaciens]|uniref:histidine kinase n=1 Tax=Curtobacterium salicis TaxID=1779862 RepID=A0ABX0T628_9MICO|nr:signal transduction histidine kinase [Curtobacterium sp. WW7]
MTYWMYNADSTARPLHPLERLLDAPSPRSRRVARIAGIVLPTALTLYSVWYDALAAGVGPDTLQIVVFVVGGLSLHLLRRLPVVPTVVAPVVWALTGSCSFVVVMSAVVAARRGPGWWAVLAGFTLLHPLGIVPDPCMFRAGHVTVPEETAPLLAVVLPALLGGVVGEAHRVVRAREEHLRLAADAAAARAADAVAQERLRLSRDLHDVVGQGVSRMTLHATALAARTAEPAVQELATRIADTGAGLLEDLHFVVGLLRRSEGDDQRDAPDCDDPCLPSGPTWDQSIAEAERDGIVLRRRGPAAGPLARTAGLDDRCAAVLDAVLAETLHNVRKHAPGSPVDLSAAILGDRVRLVVENGAGDGQPTRSAGGHGLAVAAERAAEVGGALRHDRTASGGFRLELELPR